MLIDHEPDMSRFASNVLLVAFRAISLGRGVASARAAHSTDARLLALTEETQRIAIVGAGLKFLVAVTQAGPLSGAAQGYVRWMGHLSQYR